MKNNPETLRQYRQREDVKAKRRESSRKYRLAHLEERREKEKEYARKRRQEYRELTTSQSSRSRHGADHNAIISDMRNRQQGRCYLCGDEFDPVLQGHQGPHIDHDYRCCGQRHTCRYCRRGLACAACNMLVGKAHDDPDRLRRIADNLQKAKSIVTIALACEKAWPEMMF